MITGGVLDAKEKGTPGELKMDPAMVRAVPTSWVSPSPALAVMPTRPARTPLRVMERSGFFIMNQLVKAAESPPMAAAIEVVTQT